MSIENFVMRTVYVDPDVDDRLRHEAADTNLSKAELFRRYLVSGRKKAQPLPERLDVKEASVPLVLRTVQMDTKLDDKLRIEAFDSHTSKNDLMRHYVRRGMGLE